MDNTKWDVFETTQYGAKHVIIFFPEKRTSKLSLLKYISLPCEEKKSHLTTLRHLKI